MRVFNIVFSILTLVAFFACMPKEGNKKANCPSGETFDSVSRKCVSSSSGLTTTSDDPDENHAPVGTLLTITIDEDSTPITHELTFTDQDGDDPISCTITENDPFGVVTFLNIGVGGTNCECIGQKCYVYISPDSNQNGLSGFTYKIRDDYGDWSAEQSVSITVNAVNDAPSFASYTYAVPATLDEPFDTESIPTLGFSVPTASDVDSTSYYYQVVTDPGMGSIANCMGKNGSLLTDVNCDYTPSSGDVNGVDNFTYWSCDGYLCSDTVQVSITINATNDSPVAASLSDTFTGYEDGDNNPSTTVTAILTNVTDPDDANLTFEILSGPTYGATSLNGATLSYTIGDGDVNDNNVDTKLGRSYIDTFTYRACDVAGLCSATVYATVSIIAKNDAPYVASPGGSWAYDSVNKILTYSASESSTYTATQYIIDIPVPTDAEILYESGGALSYGYSTISGFGGTLDEVNFTGTPYFKYTPENGNITGIESLFKYKAFDGENYSDEYTVKLYIEPVNDEPIICEYSGYDDAPECGIYGCYAAGSPIDTVVPLSADLYYFDSYNGNCYRSNSSSGWEMVAGSHIANHSINEGDSVRITRIRVDEGGGSTTEDIQSVFIKSVASSNTNLVSPENVIFSYNSVQIGTGADALIDITDGITNSGSGAMNIEVIPNGGNFGDATVSFTLTDSGGAPGGEADVSFVITVNQVSASHQGWANIKAFGPRVNNQLEVRDNPLTCTYNLTECDNGNACTGAGAPTSLAAEADGKYAVFYDSANDKCYYSDDDLENPGSYEWKKFNSTRYQNPNDADDTHYQLCNVSPTETSTECVSLGSDVVSCVGDDSPVNLAITPSKRNTFFYDKTNDKCYRSTGNSASTDWQNYDATGTVELSWNDFLVYGTGSIEGFNAYRRLAGESFDYESPINKTIIPGTATVYTDNGQNSWTGPVPKTVYYYEIRPVINGIATDTSGPNKTVRVVVPPENMAFVHRWAVNKMMCDMINQTDDPTNNHRCSYFGPGNTIVGSSRYYDAAEDLIVDRFEAGCNYSRPVDCVFADDPDNSKSCIGLSDPNANVTALQGKIYYDRQTGKCYRNKDNATTWDEIKDVILTTPPSGHHYAELPPLVNVTQNDAYNYCNTREIDGVVGLTMAAAGNLPTRKQQIAYSMWDSESMTDNDIVSLEAGYSMNSSSKCNSAQANGVSDNFTDDRVPASSIYYTIPATSGFQDGNGNYVRSVYTGSSLTSSCVSRFGIQDVVGNVAEWAKDTVKCSNNSCVAMTGPDGNHTLKVCDGALVGECNPATDYESNYDYFRLNDEDATGIPTFMGPCNDTSGADTNCDGDLSSWDIEDEPYNATRFFIPVGLPVHEKYPTKYPTSPANPSNADPVLSYILQIGPSSGITVEQLHNDKFVFNLSELTAVAPDIYGYGAFSTGGSYLSDTAAGVWYVETVHKDNGTTDRRIDLGFRCVYPIDSSIYQ